MGRGERGEKERVACVYLKGVVVELVPESFGRSRRHERTEKNGDHGKAGHSGKQRDGREERSTQKGNWLVCSRLFPSSPLYLCLELTLRLLPLSLLNQHKVRFSMESNRKENRQEKGGMYGFTCYVLLSLCLEHTLHSSHGDLSGSSGPSTVRDTTRRYVPLSLYMYLSLSLLKKKKKKTL
jgi:hypothetical protein